MNASTVVYWLSTALFSLLMAMSGLMYFSGAPQVVEGTAALGFPHYLLYILGTWKLLGALALLTPPSAPIPYLARIKDWAYAGFFFNLTGAAASHLFNGDGLGSVVPVLVIGSLYAASFALRPEAARVPVARLATT